jgi:arylsulfatase A-like enzyme/Tfp pilus assembly protein PilF
VTLDTTRPDHLGAWGYPHVETPTLDALARAGVRYERCYAPSPLTLPSHASLLTGLLPPRHGLRTNGARALGAEAPTLAELLRGRGYATGAAIGAFVLDRRFGLSRGFDHYDDDLAGGRAGGRFSYAERDARAVTDAALAWLEAQRGPAFLWVHYYDPHAPYAPPGFDPALARRAAYDAELEFADAELGRLLARLAETGRAERTLVVVAGDHGEALWEHGEITHGLFAYEATLRVPLLVRFPDAQHAGMVVREPVALVDVLPSILVWLGIPAPAGLDGEPLPLPEPEPGPAQPTAAEAAPGAGGRPRPRPLYFENLAPAEDYGWSALRGVVQGDLKWIEAPRPELYDLAADPHEARNLLGEREAEAAALRERLAGLASELEARGAYATEAAELGAAERARLRALGYLPAPAASAGGGAEEAPAEAADPKDRAPVHREIQRALSQVEGGELAAGVELLAGILAGSDPGNRRAAAVLAELALEEPVRPRIVAALGQLDLARLDRASAAFAAGRLGLALDLEGRPEEAVSALRRSLEADPTDPAAHWHLARVLDSLEAPEAEIAAHLLRAAELSPGDPTPLLALAQVHERAGRVESAISLYEEVLARDPDQAVALNNLAYALGQQGRDLSRALSLAERALAAEPARAAFHDTRGFLLLALGEPRLARAALEEALRLDPESAASHYHLGLALERGGEPGTARRHLERAIALGAGDSAAWLADARTRLAALPAGP